MKIASIVGTRAQCVEAAVIDIAARSRPTIDHLLVHVEEEPGDWEPATEFRPGPPDVDLPANDRAPDAGLMMLALEGPLADARPDFALVYEGSETTLAGTLAAARLGIPVAHVGAGVRNSPSSTERANHLSADWAATLRLCSTRSAVDNLAGEGIDEGVVCLGDVLCDAVASSLTRARMSILHDLGLRTGSYYLMALGRSENVGDAVRFGAILAAASALPFPVVLLAGPHLREAMERHGVTVRSPVRLAEPVRYLESIALQMHARAVLTDSGSIQREAYALGVPCVTLLDETEWPETVTAGWNTPAGADPERIRRAVGRACPRHRPTLFGEGGTADAILTTCQAGPPSVARPRSRRAGRKA